MEARRVSPAARARAGVGAGVWEVHAQVDSGPMAMAAAQRRLASNSSTGTSRAATPTAEASTLMSKGSTPTARASTVLQDPRAPRVTVAVLNASAPSLNPTPNLTPSPSQGPTPSQGLGLRKNSSGKLDAQPGAIICFWRNPSLALFADSLEELIIYP